MIIDVPVPPQQWQGRWCLGCRCSLVQEPEQYCPAGCPARMQLMKVSSCYI